MKKLFAGRRKEEEEDHGGNTLDRLVRGKEGMRKRLEEEERDFLERKKEYTKNIIQFEKQEVERRDKELHEKREQLLEKRRLNQAVQDKFVEQMKLLQIKLEEVREDHARTESSLEAEISALQDKLTEVQSSLADRLAEAAEPSAPTDPDTHLYPDLQSIARHNITPSGGGGGGGGNSTSAAAKGGLPSLRPFSELRNSGRYQVRLHAEDP